MNKDFALGFLVGAIDGEGSFMLKPQVDVRVLKKGRSSLSIRVSMEIENTCKSFIDKVEEALQVIDVGSFQVTRNFRGYDQLPYYKRYGYGPRSNSVLGGGKNYYRLSVVGRDDLKRLILATRNELTTKVEAVTIIMEFLDRVGDQPFYRATREDLEFCARLFDLQGRRRKPFPWGKWEACLRGDWMTYNALKDEPTPCQAEGNEAVRTSEGVEASR